VKQRLWSPISSTLIYGKRDAILRREWIAALDTIEALNPSAVIAGQKRAENDDSPRIIEETRPYIRDFDRLAAITTTARELFDKMLEIYPGGINPGVRCAMGPHFWSRIVRRVPAR
jgi:hypothetical protein